MINKKILIAIIYVAQLTAADTDKLFNSFGNLFQATNKLDGKIIFSKSDVQELIKAIDPASKTSSSHQRFLNDAGINKSTLSGLVKTSLNGLATKYPGETEYTINDIQTAITEGINNYLTPKINKMASIEKIANSIEDNPQILKDFKDLLNTFQQLAQQTKDAPAFNKDIINDVLRTSVQTLQASYDNNLTLKNYIDNTTGLEAVKRFFNFLSHYTFGTDTRNLIDLLDQATKDINKQEANLTELRTIIDNDPSLIDTTRIEAKGTGITKMQQDGKQPTDNQPLAGLKDDGLSEDPDKPTLDETHFDIK